MALALALSVYIGDEFTVGARKFLVVQVSDKLMLLIREIGGDEFLVTQAGFFKIDPDISFRVGRRSTNSNPRIDIIAPRHVQIWRGEPADQSARRFRTTRRQC